MDENPDGPKRNYPAEAIKPQRISKRKRAKKQAERLFYICLFLALFAHLTNPFTWFSVVKDPYEITSGPKNQFILTQKFPIYVTQNILYKAIAEAKSGWHILINRLRGGPKTETATLDQIIREIHTKRFNPNEPYLISGDHFSVFYPRSLGIFYNTLLDPRTALDEADWYNRQALYLKTTAYALSVFEKTSRLATTIVPIGPNGVTVLNIFAPPSDTLYSLLYALSMLTDGTMITDLYPFGKKMPPALSTQNATEILLQDHRQSLQKHLKEYTESVYDEQTGLVRSSVVLSGTKDSVIRHEAFYDNVVLWATLKLASELDLVDHDETFLSELKQRIISKYWDNEHGYFREDFSPWNEHRSDTYSSDWLIALMTGFLSPDNPEDVTYITRSISYIIRQEIHKPFALRYQSKKTDGRLHTIVGMFAPSYGTTAIWSHWGMEYTKALLRLYAVTCEQSYLAEAKYTIEQYTENMETYRGFPEVYTEEGALFSQTLYTSVRGTGWVVNFEQASAMLAWTEEEIVNQCANRL